MTLIEIKACYSSICPRVCVVSLLSLLAITLPVTPSCSKVCLFAFACPSFYRLINKFVTSKAPRENHVHFLFVYFFLFQILSLTLSPVSQSYLISLIIIVLPPVTFKPCAAF